MPKLPPTGDRPQPRRTLGMDERPPMKKHPRGILREWPATHAWSDGAGRVWTHQGTGAECREPACVAWRRERRWERKRPSGDPGPDSGDPWTEGTPGPAPWGYPRRDADGPCPKRASGEHYWRWADDGNGHSGDACECGAYRP